MGPKKHARENSFSMLCSSCYVEEITFAFPVAIVFSVVFGVFLHCLVVVIELLFSQLCCHLGKQRVSVKFLANVVLLSFRHTSLCNQFIERSCEHVIQSGLCLNDNSLS